MEPKVPVVPSAGELIDQVWLAPTWLNDLLPAGWGVWAVPFYEGLLAAAVLALAWALLGLVAPKTYTIAAATSKEGRSQTLFVVVNIVGLFLIVILFPFLPYNTFGEDVKMVKDGGLAVIMILAAFMAVWTASVSVSDEIEGRTAVTLLSKPVGRRDFIVGKLLGVLLGPVAHIFLILGTAFLFTICYKVGYDARENTTVVTEAGRMAEMTLILPGLVLAFYESAVLASIAVAISTRLPLLPNLLISASVYVLGHLMPVVVQTGNEQAAEVQFVAKLLSVVLPNLDHFSMQAAVATGRAVPMEMIAWTGLYALLYITGMVILGLLLFEDRDLA